MLPRLPFVVIDMNTCRSEEMMGPLLRKYDSDGQRVILPAIALWEMSKGSVGTPPASLRLVSSRPDALWVAKHSFRFKSEELRLRRRLGLGSIIDHGHTRSLRNVLRGLRDDTHVIDPGTVAAVRDHWRSTLDREDEPAILREMVQVHQRELSARRANDIRAALQRAPSDRLPFHLYLTEAMGGRVPLARFLRGVGYGSSVAKRLVRFPSFSIIYLFALSAIALRWRIFGGADTAKDAVLENAIIDAEYAVLAAYGRGYVTRDEDAHAAFESVLFVAQRIWPTPAH